MTIFIFPNRPFFLTTQYKFNTSDRSFDKNIAKYKFKKKRSDNLNKDQKISKRHQSTRTNLRKTIEIFIFPNHPLFLLTQYKFNTTSNQDYC